MGVGINNIEVVVAGDARLGEGPTWDTRTSRLVWVDVLDCKIHSTDTGSGSTVSIDVPSHIGAVVPRDAGGFVAALADGFWAIGDGDQRLIAAVDAGDEMRFNDGKCDPAGRFWAGTMGYSEEPGRGHLYRLDLQGSVSKQLAGITVSNGLAWSGDQRTMFYIDTPTRRVDRFAFDPDSGAISDRQAFFEIEANAGYPDGMTIDAQDGLWIAMWDGGRVHRYVDGRLDRVIEMPVSRPTSVTFGGPELEEMFVTSASVGLSVQQRTEQPLAGALFRIRPGVTGVPAVAYQGI